MRRLITSLKNSVQKKESWMILGAMLLGCLMTASPVQAQGLLWNLPESGSWVRYSGDYRQVTIRPDSKEGDLRLQWKRVLEIRCLERIQAEYQEKTEACVWLEFEVITGQQVDGQLEAGPGAKRQYKVLVPESVITGKKNFKAEVPQSFIPIVKGYRQLGNGKVEPMQAKVLQIFPVLSQVFINEDTKVTGQEEVTVPTETYSTDRVECSSSIEDARSRTSNETQIWIAEKAPFGAAKWSVRIIREVKSPIEKRDLFRKHSEITVEMQAVQTGTDATSKVVAPK